jgi:hypothetical protein
MSRATFTALALAALLNSRAAGQRVEIRLHEQSSPRPVVGAIIRLLGARGPVAQGLTTELGRLTLRAPAPGTYRLRVDRIGWQGFVTDSFALAGGQTQRLDIPMASSPAELPTLVVEGKSRCNPKAQGGPLATALWDEVKKALTANVITEDQGIPLHVREFVREVDLNRRPLREWVVVSRLSRGAPFASVSASTLEKMGFVYEVGDTARFDAPDASLLLSDQFVRTHCFRAVPGTAELAGLAFEPSPDRRVPEVMGTLWVDRFSSELRHIEFAYTGLVGLLRDAALGGRVEFHRLPSGAWIVGYWHVRMPRVESKTVFTRRDSTTVNRLAGYIDRGGRAETARDTTGRVDRAIVRGRVFDSTMGGGLAGAFVGVRGTRDSIRTDAEGRFELAVEASGDQEVWSRHPKLGLLREATRRHALLSLGDTTVVNFGVPSLAAFASTLCGAPRRPAIVGVAWRLDGTPLGEQAMVARRNTGKGLERVRESTSNAKGVYALCDLFSDGPVVVRMEIGKLTLFQQSVQLASEEVRWVDVREWGAVDSSSAQVMVESASEAEVVARHGRAVVLGRVVDSTTGLGLAGAVVRVRGLPDSAVTDGAGGYSLAVGTSGDQWVSAVHPAHLDLVGGVARPATLALGDTATVTFQVIPVSAVVRRVCGVPRDRSGLLGFAFGSSLRPEQGLRLSVGWLTSTGFRLELQQSGPRGLYSFCDLPPGRALALRVVDIRGGSGGGSIRLERGEYRWQEVRTSP